MAGLAIISDLTFTQCKESCYNLSVCHTFEYHSKIKACRIQKEAFDVDKAELLSARGINSYILKKRCRTSSYL